MSINLHEYQLEANSIIVLLPNYIIQILEQDENLEIEFLMFSFEFVSDIKMMSDADFVEKVQSIVCLKVDEENTNDLLDFHAFILKQYKRTNYNEVIIKNLLEALMNKILLIYRELEKGIRQKRYYIRKKYFNAFYPYYSNTIKKNVRLDSMQESYV